MGSFKIKTCDTTCDIRFAQQKRTAPQLQNAQQAQSKKNTLAADQVSFSPQAQVSAERTSLQEWLGEDKQKGPDAGKYMKRLTTRVSGFEVGSESLKMAVGMESEAPTILTRDRDPNLTESLRQQYGSQAQSPQGLPAQDASGEQLVHAGARIQAMENLHLQVGVASRLDAQQLMSGTFTSNENPMTPGVYASAEYKTSFVSTQVSVDTAYGKPRVEFGTAVNAADVATVGVSFQYNDYTEEQKLRFGTEVRATQDTAIGVSVYQPIKAVDDATQTAVGVYLNTKFD